MSQASSVSSDMGRGREWDGSGVRNGEENLHQAVSSESAAHPGAGPGGREPQAPESKGAAEREGGSIEDIAGFDPSHALELAELGGEDVAGVEALEHLPEAGELEFLEPETVCGRDDRVHIAPATNTPWRWICQLIITMANGNQSRCTGWFIGRRTVMTCGHCVFFHSAGGWVRQIEVIPGMNGSSRPFGSQVGTTFRSVLGWTRDQNPEYDYGAIILPNTQLGDRVGFFGFASLNDASLRNLQVNNAGYAGDKPFGTQWFNAGPVATVSARRLEYMIDTAGGHSGSAIWRLQSGQRHAVGVHGYGGCPNKAVRITQEVFNNMVAWRTL